MTFEDERCSQSGEYNYGFSKLERDSPTNYLKIHTQLLANKNKSEMNYSNISTPPFLPLLEKEENTNKNESAIPTLLPSFKRRRRCLRRRDEMVPRTNDRENCLYIDYDERREIDGNDLDCSYIPSVPSLIDEDEDSSRNDIEYLNNSNKIKPIPLMPLLTDNQMDVKFESSLFPLSLPLLKKRERRMFIEDQQSIQIFCKSH